MRRRWKIKEHRLQSFREQPISILMDLALTFLDMVRSTKRETRKERVGHLASNLSASGIWQPSLKLILTQTANADGG